MKYGNTHVIETAWKQRQLDKKWMLLGKIFDVENTYTYKNEFGSIFNYVPTIWIILDVKDYKPKKG